MHNTFYKITNLNIELVHCKMQFLMSKFMFMKLAMPIFYQRGDIMC